MRILLVKLLSILVHHANRNADDHFYKLKTKLLNKYGTFICNEVQVIPAIKCTTCYNGIYTGYDWNGYQFSATCRSCGGSGVYKNTSYNKLAKYKLGDYTFHQPVERLYNYCGSLPVIKGYIRYSHSKYGNISKKILYLMFDWRQFMATFKLRFNLIQTIKYRWHHYKQSKVEYDFDELPF